MRGYGKERDMLDIGVMHDMICDKVVDIVVRYPPADAQPSDKISDENAKESILDPAVGNSHVSQIMGGKNQLVPE